MKRYGRLAILPLLLGCESARKTIGWDVPEPQYGAALEVQPPDVPVPAEFKLQTGGKETAYLVGGRYRDACLVYLGDGILDDVVHFYRIQMKLPINGWAEDGLEKADRKVTLRFVKGEYRCTVQVSRRDDFSPLRIDVDLKTYL